jgi:hypothetical protein
MLWVYVALGTIATFAFIALRKAQDDPRNKAKRR